MKILRLKQFTHYMPEYNENIGKSDNYAYQSLVLFVNENEIKREDIVSIMNGRDYSELFLYYYA